MGSPVEVELEGLVRSGAFDRAATQALETYGAELYGFLISLAGGESDATEIYSQVCEDLWAGLPKFALRCSVRTWLYVLARHAAARFRRSPWNHGARRTGDSQLDELIARSRTQTEPWRRTDAKDRFSALRESLDADDRALLVLRVDRALPWHEVARVMLEDEEPDEVKLAREVDRLTKRFQLLKDDLRRRAREAGLVDS
jgi:RNA polymerase sigma-70 factor (ECF subfamily)